jgi:uncharacterized membrane protein YeiH
MLELSALLTILDFGAVGVFAASGALAAARRKHDIVTFAFFGAITGVGGGTLRDLLIGAPVFWVQRPEYIEACLVAAVAVWVLGSGPARARFLLWSDALGMAAYTVVGAMKAQALGAAPLPSVVMGVLTACFGGIIRDVLANEPSVLLRRELYVTPAMVGAAGFVALRALGLDLTSAGLIGFALAFAIRAGAILFRWRLAGFPGRVSPEGDD